MKKMLARTQRQRRRQTAEHSASQCQQPSVNSPEPLVRPADLAWALADAAKPHLDAAERSHVYVSIGLDETFAAIRDLITSAADKRIALPADLIDRCHDWLDVHVDHEEERYLRGLVEQVLSPYAIRHK
jgi:hypothetical protein